MLARNVAKVNSALMLHARSPLRLAEIARAAALPKQIVASALGTLEKRGLIVRTRRDDHDLFEPDKSSPHFRSAYLSALVDLPVREVLGSRRVMAAYVYGSLATPGGGTPQSDLDILLVGDFQARGEARFALTPLGERLERRIDAFVLSPEELELGRAKQDPRVASALAGERLFGEV